MPIEKPNFFGIPLEQIRVEDRKRKIHGDIESLADSIEKFGLFHPIIITRDKRLVAGERRYRAFQHLKRKEIPAQFVDQLNDYELKEIELEENTRRLNMTWQEEAQAVYDYHQHRMAGNSDWNLSCTADCLRMSEKMVTVRVVVAREMQTTPDLTKVENLSTAYNAIQRKQSRAMDNELEALLEVEGPAKETEESEGATEMVLTRSAVGPVHRQPSDSTIVNMPFAHFLEQTDRKFNLLHMDLPYGSNFQDSGQVQHATWEGGTYDDSGPIFNLLMHEFLTNLDNFVAQSAHVIFWYQSSRYQEMVQRLSPHFRINPIPLIWVKSDSTGILSDPKRGPRHIYETALLLTRGDRSIVGPVNNAISFPANRAKANHPSEKPFEVVHHFLRMLVDDSTIFLDPTCGSGTAVAAAEKLGAGFVQGVEMNPQHAETARRVLNRYRA